MEFFFRFVDIISNSQYKIPHRNTLATTILDETYQNAVNEIINYSKQCVSLAITTDGWSDFTLIGIDKNLNINSMALHPNYNEEDNSNENVLDDLIKEFNIDVNKIKAIVTNDEESIRKIPKEIKHYPCSATRFYNAIKDAIATTIKTHLNLGMILTVLKLFIKRYKKSYSMRQSLSFELDDLFSLKKSFLTRWNYIYHIIRLISKNKNSIIMHINKDKLPHYFKILANDKTWKIFNDIEALLIHFNKITNTLTSDKKPTINLVVLCIVYLKKVLEETQVTTECAKKLKENLISYVSKYFIPFNKYELIACFLNAKIIFSYKDSDILLEYTEQGKFHLLETLIENSKDEIDQNADSDNVEDDSILEHLKEFSSNENNLEFSMDELYKKSFDSEIKSYIALASKKKFSVVKFWNCYKDILPNIYDIFTDIIVIPATIISCEREYPKISMPKFDTRNRLKDEKFRKLSFLGAYSTQKHSKKRKRSINNSEEDMNLDDNNEIELNDKVDNSNLTYESDDPDLEKKVVLVICQDNQSLIFGLFTTFNDNYENLNESKVFRKGKKFICNFSPIKEDGVILGFSFELSESGKQEFENCRKSFINEMQEHINV